MTVDNLVNMYIFFLLQVVFTYFVKKKNNQKEGKKVLKEQSKDLEKIRYPKEKMNKTWKWASINATTFYFLTMAECQ